MKKAKNNTIDITLGLKNSFQLIFTIKLYVYLNIAKASDKVEVIGEPEKLLQLIMLVSRFEVTDPNSWKEFWLEGTLLKRPSIS